MTFPYLFFATALGGCFLDLLTKTIVFGLISGTSSIDIIAGFFALRTGVNTGVVWGLFQGAPAWVLAVISLIAIPFIILMYFWLKPQTFPEVIALGLILGGAMGNCYDRVVYGSVRDFIDFYLPFIRYSWPLFNLADVFISIGAILFIILLLRGEKTKQTTQSEPQIKA